MCAFIVIYITVAYGVTFKYTTFGVNSLRKFEMISPQKTWIVVYSLLNSKVCCLTVLLLIY